MSMSTHVIGIRPPTDEYKRKVVAWKACVAAGVAVPDELLTYFDGEGPNDDGMHIDLDEHECCVEYSDDMKDGFTVDLTKVPEGVQFVRFYNSY